MHTIEIFLEYHWAVERPELNFNLNGKKNNRQHRNNKKI
jgi:hypothetical protein